MRGDATVAIVEWEKQGDVAVLRMNNPPVNALGHALRDTPWSILLNVV